MSVEIQWNDLDPVTGEKRFVTVERFAGRWSFKVRARRRELWQKVEHPTRAMWEEVLDTLERRYRRREGVSEVDLEQVRTILTELKEAPTIEAE